MCIRRKVCTELGDDPNYWSKDAPLPPPPWFEDEVTKFSNAVRSAAAGDLETAKGQLALLRSDELREWFGEHAQQAGHFRCFGLGGRRNNQPLVPLDPLRSTLRYEAFVYERDGYRCRYCSFRVFPGVVLKAFSNVIWVDAFGVSGPRPKRHGAAVAFKACADHVLPHFLGGRTNLDNLVTACWGCNFGKNYYTVEEIGIEDPRLRPPLMSDGWDGLMSLVPELKKRLHENTNKVVDRLPTPRVAKQKRGTPKGFGGVSIAKLHSWLTEWKQNGERPPESWTPFRVNFFERNLEIIRDQTKTFNNGAL
jgi:HNH endonuclease